MNDKVKKGFIEIDFEGEGITYVSVEALTHKVEKTAVVVKGKIGKIIQMPIKNLRR